MSDSTEQRLPAERRDPELDELEPHQRTIERAADVYFGACERLARSIRTVKDLLRSSDSGE